MPQIILSHRAEYPVSDAGERTRLYVSLLQPARWFPWLGGEAVDAQVVARQISPHMQHQLGRGAVAGTALESEISAHMGETAGYAVAYQGTPYHILAFAFLRPASRLARMRRRQPEYVFEQFGVTMRTDLRDMRPRSSGEPDIGMRRLRAAAALMYTLTEGLPDGANLVVPTYPEDTRTGYFFEDVGFMRQDGSGQCVRRPFKGTVGVVRAHLLTDPNYGFLLPGSASEPSVGI